MRCFFLTIFLIVFVGVNAHSRSIEGKVVCNNKGIKNVVVSDGKSFATTSARGKFMSGRVGVLGTEGGAKGIDLAIGQRIGLALQLTGNRQVSGLAEKVLGIVDATVLVAGRVVHIQRGNTEHLACALTVGGGDDGGMHVNKTTVVEELVNGKGGLTTHTEYGREQVGSGAQVGLLTQELYGVALGLEGVLGSGGALYGDLGGLDLKGLLHGGGQLYDALYHNGGAHVLLGDLVIIGDTLTLENHLHALKAATVVQVDKAKGLAVTQVAHPAAQGDLFAGKSIDVIINGTNKISFHIPSPFGS